MNRKKGKKAFGGSKPGTKHVVWSQPEWAKVAKEYATVYVRLSGGGERPSFAKVFPEAQMVLPKARRKPVPAGISMYPEYFSEMIEAEKQRLTSPASWKASKEAANEKSAKINGAANGSKLELITSVGGHGFTIPPGISLNDNFRVALRKAGFKLVDIKDINELEHLLCTDIGGIENMAHLDK
jgi:hypothetical protein